MKNYDKRLEGLNVDKLIQLENEVLECDSCYCREFCESKTDEKTSCDFIRKEWLMMEAEGITYTLVGDYLLPDLILPCQDDRPIGIYGKRHGEYLKAHNKIDYYSYLTSGTLSTYLADINEQAMAMQERLIEDMKAAENVNEGLKERDFMEWVRQMNSIKNRVEEMVNESLIYN